MLKDRIQCSLMKEPAYFWTNHLALAFLLLCITASQIMGIALYLLAMGCQLLLPSLDVPELPLLPKLPTLEKEEAYLANVI